MDRFTPDYQFALVACYLGEALGYLAKGNLDDFFQLGRVAGNTCDFASKLLATAPPKSEVVVTLADRESGLGIRPSWQKRLKAPKKPLTGPFRNVTDHVCESQPESRGAHRLFFTLYLDCGHETVRVMYESQRGDAPRYVRCDKCPRHAKSSAKNR